MVKAGIIRDTIDLNKELMEIARKTTQQGGGAIVLFMGYVKGRVDDTEVYELDYEAYEPYATRVLEEIARQAEEKDNVLEVRIYHRIGNLKPGEPTIYVIVASTTRKTAFKTAEEVLEQVKHKTPVFKLEKRSNGEYWVIGDGKRIKRRNLQKHS